MSADSTSRYLTATDAEGRIATDRSAPPRSSRWTAAAVAVAAAGLGVALAVDVQIALALVAAVAFATILWFDLRLAILVWVPIVFLDGVAPANAAGKAAGVLILLGWLVAWPRSPSHRLFRDHPWLPAVLVAFGVWLSLSVIWSADAARAVDAVWQWYAVGLVLVIVATAMAHRRPARLVAGAFVVGAVLSVVVGVALPGVGAGEEGRFQGGVGDPNLLAVGLVPAAILALGLATGQRDRRLRWATAAVVAVLLVGFAASGSRGGLVGAVATAVAALVLLARRRTTVVAASVLTLVAVGGVLVGFPAAWERSDEVGAGSGRGDLWTVAWHTAGDHPLTGVGLANYPEVAGDYVRQVGPLRAVDLIAAEPQVHNMYLQMLAETGLVGLLLFVAVIGGCVWAAWRAARRFTAVGDRAHAALATAVVLAMFSMLVSGIFISHAVDRRLWVLLALGPALLAATRIDPDG